MAENEVKCATGNLQWICQIADQAGEPHVDLSGLLGLTPGAGPLLSVENLASVIAAHEEPEVSISWDDSSLSIARTDGGVMATFEVKF